MEWENFEKESLTNLEKYATFSREPFYKIAKKYLLVEKRTLDVGAGTGDFAAEVGDENIYLVEGNPRTAELLKTRYQNTHCITLPAQLPFEDKFFHLIHCSHLIEHLTPQELWRALKEFDRCLDFGGHLVISTPLLWDGFYDDLSHVKPYGPYIFYKYLCNKGQAANIPMTRDEISHEYQIVELVYRYRLSPFPYIRHHNTLVQKFLYKLNNKLRDQYFGYYEKTGYTIVLNKILDKADPAP